MDISTFLKIPTPQVAQIVKDSGLRVVVFPINGTRRWFVLEGQSESGYVETMLVKHTELYRLFFDHGIKTLVTPAFGPDLLERGPTYIASAVKGLADLCQHSTLLEFYETYDVQVRFYGDYRKYLQEPTVAHLPALFDDLTARTSHHTAHYLWFGLFAHDATDTLAERTIAYWQKHQRQPDKQELVAQYYGAPLDPVDIFIGFDKFSFFDVPLIATGNEDLYYTVSPSLYLTADGLRSILFDHLYNRRLAEADYESFDPAALTQMRQFYQANRNEVLGVGVARNGIWYPY
jgi:tuberculosinol/isotuberculosinol synthase